MLIKLTRYFYSIIVGVLVIRNGKVNCGLAGDKGGDSWSNVTKFGFFIETNKNANSYKNFSIICLWIGSESRSEQEKHLRFVLQQIENIKKICIDKEEIDIQWFI